MADQRFELPKRLPLIASVDNRGSDLTKDSRIVNGYAEKQLDGSYHVFKRPGYTYFGDYSAIGASTGYGIFNWLGDTYSVFDTGFYKNGTLVDTIGDNGKPYSFASVLGATPQLAFSNGTDAYHYDSGAGVVAMGGVQPPTGNCPGWAYLDGTLYYIMPTAAINGSGINDLDTWEVLNTITAQMEPDGGVALAKHLAYVVAFKEWTTEIFYDAGTSPCSLGTVQGAKINWGCGAARSVLEIDGELFWLGTTRNGSVSALRLEKLTAVVISTPQIDKLLEPMLDDVDYIYTWAYKGAGHVFYVITHTITNITLAYDITEGLWYQWTDKDGNYLPFAAATFTGRYTILQHMTNGYAYGMATAITDDLSDPVRFELFTPNFDAGVGRRKTLHRLQINADQTQGSVLQIRCNDHDYQSDKWTNYRPLDLGKERPFLTNCGTFYRRAYHMKHECSTPLRLKSVDLSLDLGTI